MARIKSIIPQDFNTCYCRDGKCKGRLEAHHMIYGRGRRAISDREGLIVMLCQWHHKGTEGVHGKKGDGIKLYLQQIAQETWEQNFIKEYPYKNHAEEAAREAWIRMMGANYL